MKKTIDLLSKVLNSPIVFLVSSISAIAIFGITLGITWLPASPTMTEYKLLTSIIAATIGVVFGGSIFAYISGKMPLVKGFVFGITIGFISSGYLFGVSWMAVSLIAIASAAGISGGIVVKSMKSE